MVKKKVTCVIPAHNEGEGIQSTLKEIDKATSKTIDLTIYVSEDGSTDNTRQNVLEAAERIKSSRITLSNESGRLGYSKAVQQGILNTTTEIIWFMDSDGQYFPEDVLPLIEKLSPGTVVVGYRNPRADGFNRKFYSALFGIAYRMFGFPKRIDPSSPFVVAYLEDIKSISTKDFHLNYGYWWEFQARVAAAGLSVVELPVRHRVRFAGETQVYTPTKLPKIVSTHLLGLKKLRQELRDQ